MEQPLVSILVSAYNAEKYIKEAIDSALAQTYKNIEVVVIDAGSTDSTGAIVKTYTDPRVRYILHGYEPIIVTRNGLLREAKGEFLTFLDSDDIYMPEKVDREVEFLTEHPEEYGIVYCNLKYFYDGTPDVYYHHRYTFYSGNVFERLLEKMFITNTAVMMRRSVVHKIGGYNEALGVVEDWDFFLRAAHAGFKIGFIDENLVRYRLRWDSHTNFKNQIKIQQSAVNIFENLKQNMTPEEHARYNIDHAVRVRKTRLLIAFIANGKRREAWSLYKELRGEHWFALVFIPFCLILLVPSGILRFVIERGWNRKKKNLFILIDDTYTS